MAANTSGSHTQDAAAAAARGFVVRNGSRLFHNGKPFYYVGANAYWFIDFYTLSWGREQIDEFLDAAQALGLQVIRTWMFNDALPKAAATYDARQLAGLDYIMWSCKTRGIMLLLTLGNLWNAYKGPEDFLAMATGTAEGKDILDFYRDPATRSLFKLHIWGLISRVNPLTGLAPKDDPNIFGWSLLNEPRCPGCNEPYQQAIHQDWLSDMASFLRAADPLHLIGAATEGFFVEDRRTLLHWHNPGPGAQCDGEDWFSISTIPQLDYTSIHVYERHMELLPKPSGSQGDWPNWIHCGWSCYVNWFKNYVQLHTYLSETVLNKPMIIEEFGLTWFKKTLDQQRVLFKVTFDMLEESAQSGGALAGAMFWNAAHNNTIDSDGYNLVDQLDPFRRAGWREACAVEAAKTWRPYRLFNLTDNITTAPKYVKVLESGDVVGVISDATAKLNRLRQQSPAAQQPPPPPPEVVSQSGRK
ncbi:hypothetical protein OEZ85_006029 [Tetradesmus obliquus]|uniref:mannan endo-1,4-beta-mannosidase n=1 Tax=Tetradesmus obliquus TaxID=3088 RepID=A0ABY8UIH1_TETOB|nr:hypothetical protein OEZ85_006029 [Tetradesmus obliquus]